MQVRSLAGDEPGDPVRHAVQLHVPMSQADIELWEGLADRRRLDMDDAVHAAALSGLKYELAHDGDEMGARAAEVCERELIARLGLQGVHSDPPGGERM